MVGSCYENRELSWLKFNERVLEEALDSSVPLCERLKFASIFQSNLDEFFMIRVGSLYDQMLIDSEARENKTNMTSGEQLDAVFKRVAELTPQRDDAYKKIIDTLSTYGVQQVDFRALSDDEEKYMRVYFENEIRPLISPQVIDKRHPFPFFKNKEIYAVAYLESKSSVRLGVIPASGVFSRLIFLPDNNLRFMLVEELILHYMPIVFEDYKIIDKSLLRITRNADINAEEALYDHDVDFRDAMTELIKKRKKLSPVRMELSRKLDSTAVDYLCEKFEITHEQIIRLNTPLDLSFVFGLCDKLRDKQELFFPKRLPQKSPCVNEHESMIDQIRRKDILLSYPYESINPFIRLLNEAADDENVVSMKITLYRMAKGSKIVEALVRAAENGKEVLVLVELRARFDEENNIEWSRQLEDAGCNVIYGLSELKVHSKLLLITRKNGDKIEFISQIGTGNYNEKTSTLYTDLSLMTANENIGKDAVNVFSRLALNSCVESASCLLVAPKCLQSEIIAMIDAEIEQASKGNSAYIGLKLNSLTDKVLIDHLIKASVAGVKVDLIIRGICCLVSGIEGMTENIRVISIVGRFLEHSRVYIFGSGDRRKVYIASADFMTRNTLRRVEVGAPVYDSELAGRICEMFGIMLRDNVKARVQLADGNYVKRDNSDAEPLNSQEYFYEKAYEAAEKSIPVPQPLPKRAVTVQNDAAENDTPSVKKKSFFKKLAELLKADD